jgi:hypothetical protein
LINQLGSTSASIALDAVFAVGLSMWILRRIEAMSEQQVKYIFRVRNRHAASLGEPPEIDGNTRNRYHGYFENEYGDQAIFIYDYEKRTGTLWLGDAGWERSFDVVDGKVPKLELGLNEMVWLQICW